MPPALPNHVVNGLRMASEATTPCLVLKYRKIGKRGFSRAFRSEKRKHRTSLPQSTDVLHQKYGCLCPRSPMFLNQKHGIFQTFCRIFLVFCRIFRRILLISAHINITKLTTQDGRTSKIRSKSALEVTRCLVKIFEGPQTFLQGSERLETGDSGRSVQYFPPRPAEPPLPSACGGAYAVTGILSGTATLVLAAGSVEVVA